MNGMIKAGDLIRSFRRMADEGWGYIPDTSGELWTQEKQDAATGETVKKYGQQWVGHRVTDCSGAFVNAYREHGQKIYHGSNRIAREYVEELLPVSQAQPGMAAFKVRDSTEQLKREYLPGGSHYNGDTQDYYHIGLVDEDPRYVINAQSTQKGVVRGRLSDGWDWVARMKAVEYTDTEEDMNEIRYVYAEEGKTVFLRQSASQSANWICRVPIGSQVEVISTINPVWSRVRYNGKTGYMMNRFLVEEMPGEDTGQPAEEKSTIELMRAELTRAREAIDRALLLSKRQDGQGGEDEG